MQNHYFGGSNPPVASNIFFGIGALVLGCSPTPSPLPESHVEWRSPEAPVDRPLAVFVGEPGGPADRVARDSDVTTFLNDRFVPLLLPAFGSQPPETAAIYTADGCVLVAPFVPASPGSWIAEANRAVVMPAASGRAAPAARARDCAP